MFSKLFSDKNKEKKFIGNSFKSVRLDIILFFNYNLRLINLKNAPHFENSFGLSQQQDAEEFLTQLFKVLNDEIHNFLYPNSSADERWRSQNYQEIIETKTDLQNIYVYRSKQTRRCSKNHGEIYIRDVENGLIMLDFDNEITDFMSLVSELSKWKQMASNVRCNTCRQTLTSFERNLLIDSTQMLIICLKRSILLNLILIM